MAPIVDGDSSTVKDASDLVPALRLVDDSLIKLVEGNGVSGEVVSLTVELLSHHRDAPFFHSSLPQVTGDFLDPEHIRLGGQDLRYAVPEDVISARGRGGPVVQQGLKSVDDGLVVHEGVSGALCRGNQVQQGEGLCVLGGLTEAVDAGREVKAVVRPVVDALGCSGEQGVGLV